MSLIRLFNWCAALALLSTFYLHTLLGRPTEELTPLTYAASFAFVAMSAGLGAFIPGQFATPTQFATFAAIIGWGAWLAWTVLTLIHYSDSGNRPGPQDLGLFATRAAVPLLLFLQPDKRSFLEIIGRACILAAVADLAWNLACVAGLAHAVALEARHADGGAVIRYPGLSGGTLAAGEVALPAICYLTAGDRRGAWARAASLVLALAILADLILVDARRYLGESLAGFLVLATPTVRRWLSPVLIAAIVAGIFYWLTMHATDAENYLRGSLMLSGWRDVMEHPLLGTGLHYRHVEITGRFEPLWAVGTTESGFIDFCVAYGIPAAVLFMAAAVLPLVRRRKALDYPVVLLALLIADFECSDILDNLLGSVLFFGAWLAVLMAPAPYRWRLQATPAEERGGYSPTQAAPL